MKILVIGSSDIDAAKKEELIKYIEKHSKQVVLIWDDVCKKQETEYENIKKIKAEDLIPKNIHFMENIEKAKKKSERKKRYKKWRRELFKKKRL